MNNLLNSARAICHTLLSHYKKEDITDDILLQAIEKANAINIVEGMSLDTNELFEILKADFSVGKGKITELTEDIEPWLNEAKANITFDLWSRYRTHISVNAPSFPINELDDFTDRILDKCVNPQQPGSWDRRGMVVGHVQSGKTSNYIGLINKATDAGYKVIIVIAGTISSLRRQTQERIDSGYIGRSSSAYINNQRENKIIGVGNYNAGTEIYSLTSSYYQKGDEGDFNQSIANRLNIPIGKNPVVFVIKKNKSILENLIDWFSKNENIKLIDGQPTLLDVPALIIDDEADAASVNATRDINDIKAINRLIRTLLTLFNQNTFIGYTATPYANLFISQQYNESLTTLIKGKTYKIGRDLFPKDFIINLKAPSNYIGAAKVFGYEDPYTGKEYEPLDIFRSIDDFDPPFFRNINRTNKDNLPEYLPPTLETAIKSFILTCAIRRLRGHEKKHNSMLIHVALLVKWIDRVAYLVNEKVREYRDAIQSKDKQLLRELKYIYEADFIPTTRNVLENLDYKDIRIHVHEWKDIEKELSKAISKIEVRAVHGTRSTTNLEYHNIEEIDYERYKENGLSVIAVGGSRLSRGITLEGLSISYYLRTTRMYDSLMQMGRWFGYRPGYADLCRLYTTNEIFSWFNHITMATEEMRNDFDEMSASLKKPKDFRLKVRNHHDMLIITSLNKLYFSDTITVTFSGANPQTYLLLKKPKAIEKNYRLLKNLIQAIGLPAENNRQKTAPGKIKYLIYPNQPVEPVCDFIGNFSIEQPNINNAVLTEYIKEQSQTGKIKEWTICIVSNTNDKVFIDPTGKTPRNERHANADVSTYEITDGKETIILGCTVRNRREQDEVHYHLTKNQIDDIRDRQVDLSVKGFKTNADIKQQREKEKKGLLLIYALDERGARDIHTGLPVVGYSIHFPKLDKEEDQPVSYTVTLHGDFEEEIMEDDDTIIND